MGRSITTKYHIATMSPNLCAAVYIHKSNDANIGFWEVFTNEGDKKIRRYYESEREAFRAYIRKTLNQVQERLK